MERARPETHDTDRSVTSLRSGRGHIAEHHVGGHVDIAVRHLRRRPGPAGRARRTVRLLAAGIAAGALLVTGCDSVSGIPDEGSDTAGGEATTPPAAVPSAAPTTKPEAATPPPIPPTAPQVAAVPDIPEAAPAVRRWAADLAAGDMQKLQRKCWTIAPQRITEMYTDATPILSALTQSGEISDDTVTWTDSVTSVSVDRSSVESGAASYACPRIHPAETEVQYDDADARHVVRRYLARFTGEPLNPADEEGRYPLVCKASPATWDPNGTGSPVSAPLANKPGTLTGATRFADQQLTSQWIGSGYIAVQAPVTDSSGATQNRTFTLTEGSDGYCIGDATP